MNIYIGDKVVKINKHQRIDSGITITNNVFRYGNYVIKLFKGVEDELFYRYFIDCDLKLNVISVPCDLGYDKEDNFVGNLSLYVDGIRDFNMYFNSLLHTNKEQLLSNLYMLKSDLEMLSKCNIIARDLRVGNCVFKDDILYHIDYGNFLRNYNNDELDNEVLIENTRFKNNLEFNNFIYNLFGSIYFNSKLSIPYWILSKDNVFKEIEEKMGVDEQICEFVKRYK